MALRDSLMSIEHFNSMIAFELNAIERRKEIARTPGVNPKYDAQYIFQIFIKSYEIIFHRYSRGDAIVDLKNYFHEVVDAWEWSHAEELRVFTPQEMAMRKSFNGNIDFYVVCLWLVSLGLCLDIDDGLFKRMLTLCGNEGEDYLFERIAGARLNGRKRTASLCHPKTYLLLKLAIEADDKEECNRLMKGFLKKWYPSLSKTYWHGNHAGVNGGGYFGYWCFEAAGVVHACRLDDREFREFPYYPKDLI